MGIMKGFAGLSSAILTQLYAVMHTPDHATLVFMVAVGPSLVAIGLMFIIRPVGGHRQVRPSDKNSFLFIYTICLLLASYLVGVMLVQDFMELSDNMVNFLTLILFILLILPIAIPVTLTLSSKTQHPTEEALLSEPSKGETSTSQEKEDQPEVILSEVEEEKPKDIDSLPPSERRKRIAELQTKLVQAAARGGVRIRRRPHRGENFTLMQALVKADFWLIWLSLLLGSGSGLTVIDNLGQMSQSVGFEDAHIFVSLISIWNFLGRVGGGYFSEIIVRYQHGVIYPMFTICHGKLYLLLLSGIGIFSLQLKRFFNFINSRLIFYFHSVIWNSGYMYVNKSIGLLHSSSFR